MAEQSDRMIRFMDQPLIGIVFYEKGQDVVHYFAEDFEADAVSSRRTIQEVLALAGAWSDLNWDEMEKGLDRIRHESQPTPPFSL
jgi:hypothetical protein